MEIKNNLQQFITDYNKNTGDEYFAKQSGLNQMMFVRDVINPLFYPKYDDRKNNEVQVVNIHYSKSVSLPVYKIETANVTFFVRDNFYGWDVSISSKHPIIFPNYLIGLVRNRGCSEGFLEEFIYENYIISNKLQFSFGAWTDYTLYNILFFIT